MNKQDLLYRLAERALPAFLENRLITSDNMRAKLLCAELISYKVLRALYDICREADSDLTWDDCVKVMKTTPQLLDATVPVILYAMENFIKNDGFDFNAGEIGLSDLIDNDEPGESDGKLRAVKLFSEDYGEFLVELFFLNAEAEFYNIVVNARKATSWKEYLSEIQKSRSMWNNLQNTFYDGLKRLDFRAGWLSDELDEVQFLQEPQPENRKEEID